MDGTGILFKPFTDLTPSQFSVDVVPLSQVANARAALQANKIESEMPSEPFILVAESYSGRVAYELLKNSNLTNLLHVVFVASFLRNPTKLSVFSSYAPSSIFNQKLLANKIGSRVAFGKYLTPELGALFLKTLNSVNAEVLKSRIDEISRMVVPQEKIAIPITYVQATKDNLVKKSAVDDFKKLFEHFNFVQMDGTHFLMQTNPHGVWKTIERLTYNKSLQRKL